MNGLWIGRRADPSEKMRRRALDKPGFVVQIYTAAEVEFASEVGKKYQVQTVSDITGTWLNVGSVTNGTGNNISMVNSTRAGNGQGYFRVVQVP